MVIGVSCIIGKRASARQHHSSKDSLVFDLSAWLGGWQPSQIDITTVNRMGGRTSDTDPKGWFKYIGSTPGGVLETAGRKWKGEKEGI